MDKRLRSLSDEQLAGQRIMAGFDGTELNEDLKYLIGTLHVGGVILFSRNIVSPDQVKKLCEDIKDYASSCHLPELFIAVDQEGGQVARLKAPFTCFPGNPAMKNVSDAVNFAKITAKELLGAGLNMNMAPVMDVVPENFNSVMDERVFGKDPSWVSKLGTAVIDHLQQNNIMAVAKHFPGIGRTTLDSHIDMPFLDIPFDDMENFDLIPFQAAIENNVSGIMLSHIRYTHLDAEWPASLSRNIAKHLLRDRMGYDGLVMTDDLDMGAIKNYYEITTSIPRILEAEVDIALICHKGPDIQNACDEILKRIQGCDKTKSRCMASVSRILSAKEKYLNC